MFQRKRQLKKEKSKKVAKKLYVFVIIALLLAVFAEIIFFNFFFTISNYISPVSKSNSSKLAIIEDELNKNNIGFNMVTLNSDGSYIIKLKDQGEVIISSKKEIAKQLSSLQLMLSRLTIEGKKLKTLDFRYDNPVVSF